jgi:hypothetical protein
MPKRPRDPNQLAKSIVDITTGDAEDSVSQAKRIAKPKGRAVGLRGGRARASNLTPQERTEIAKLAAEAVGKKGKIGSPFRSLRHSDATERLLKSVGNKIGCSFGLIRFQCSAVFVPITASPLRRRPRACLPPLRVQSPSFCEGCGVGSSTLFLLLLSRTSVRGQACRCFSHRMDKNGSCSRAQFRVIHQTALRRISVDVVKLFDPLSGGPHVEIVEPTLPQMFRVLVWSVFPEVKLVGVSGPRFHP